MRRTVRSPNHSSSVLAHVTRAREVQVPENDGRWIAAGNLWRLSLHETGAICECTDLAPLLRQIAQEATTMMYPHPHDESGVRRFGTSDSRKLTFTLELAQRGAPAGWLSEEVDDDGDCRACGTPAWRHTHDERDACRRAIERRAAADDATWD